MLWLVTNFYECDALRRNQRVLERTHDNMLWRKTCVNVFTFSLHPLVAALVTPSPQSINCDDCNLNDNEICKFSTSQNCTAARSSALKVNCCALCVRCVVTLIEHCKFKEVEFVMGIIYYWAVDASHLTAWNNQLLCFFRCLFNICFACTSLFDAMISNARICKDFPQIVSNQPWNSLFVSPALNSFDEWWNEFAHMNEIIYELLRIPSIRSSSVCAINERVPAFYRSAHSTQSERSSKQLS